MRVLVLGSTGMAGHVISAYLNENNIDVVNTVRKKSDTLTNDTVYFDASRPEDIKPILKQSNFDIVVNAIALLNNESETDKLSAITVNASLPVYLENILTGTKTRLIHISTDAVFSGKNSEYDESDLPDANTFYGRTKLLGEINNSKDITIRTSIVGPVLNTQKNSGILDWFLNQKDSVSGYTNVNWCGITTYELAKYIHIIILNNITGIYHLVPEKSITKFDLLNTFKSVYVKRITINKSIGNSINTKLVTKRHELASPNSDYLLMIKDLKNWMDKHEKFYSQYKY